MKTSAFAWRKIKTDAKMKFYTGINTIVLFNKIFRLIQPFLTDVIYWKGPKHAKNFSKVRHRRCNTPKKLIQRIEIEGRDSFYLYGQRDEFLLTLMRLRLGLLNEDLVEKFGVSPTFCSYIFTAWVKILIKQSLEQSVGCMASEGIHKRTFT